MERQTFRDFTVVICDDGSSDGTAEYLRTWHPEVVVIAGTGSLWWTAGMNRCIRQILHVAAPGDYILTINNDVLVGEDYLARKVARAREYPTAIIGSVCVFQSDVDRIETSGFVMNYKRCVSRSITARGARRAEADRGVRRVTHVPGKGVLIPVEIFRDIGLYDEVHLPHYHADTDFALRASERGYEVYVDFDALVYSDVNLANMTIASDKLTLANMLKTFRGPHSMNNFRIRSNFARNHFPRASDRARYLVQLYARIIGGLAARYVGHFGHRARTERSSRGRD
jgi:GT2 family glycosyltransferase